jgi:hypothetical protein
MFKAIEYLIYPNGMRNEYNAHIPKTFFFNSSEAIH